MVYFCENKFKNLVYKSFCCHTVVKRGHTEGIEREKTSSQNSHVISLAFWILYAFQIWGKCPHILGIFFIKIRWQYLQKLNTKCPHISDEKDKFCSIDKYIFFSFFKGSKAILRKRQNSFFSSKIWGYFAFTFWRYCHLILMKKMPFDYDWFALGK